MFGLAAVLFFSVTGITLNHPDWFFGEAERRSRPRARSTRSGCTSKPRRPATSAEDDSAIHLARSQAGGRRAPAEDPRHPRRPGGLPGRRVRVHGHLQGPGLRGRRLHRPRFGPLQSDPDVPRLHRRPQRPAQRAATPARSGPPSSTLSAIAADVHLADWTGLALLPQAPPDSRPCCCDHRRIVVLALFLLGVP